MEQSLVATGARRQDRSRDRLRALLPNRRFAAISTARIAHTGGERIKPGSPEEAVLKQWVEYLANLSGPELEAARRYKQEEAAGGGKAPVVVLRRLTNSQYNNTIRDLLKDTSNPANDFPPEDFVNGFKNQYQALTVSPLLAEAYGNAAEKLAADAFRRGDFHGLIPCKPASDNDAACRAKFIQTFGRRAFRRPLEPEEMARYTNVFRSEKPFLKGAQTVIEAMLQSPNFIFWLDETPNPKWKPYATASYLSYSLWNTTPDDALLDAVARGELNTTAGIEHITREMLDDPRAKDGLDRICFRVAAFRPRTRCRARTSRLSALQPRLGCRHDGRSPALCRRPGLERPQFHAGLHGRLGFPNSDPGGDVQGQPPARDFDRVTFPAGIRARGVARAGAVPDPDQQAGRDRPHRARSVCAGTVSMPAGASAAAQRGHQPAALRRIEAAHQPAADGRRTPPATCARVVTA